VLGPDVARHWWLLGFAQTQAKRFDEAQRSVERFFAMGGGEPGENAQARHLLDWLRERAPGGRLRQQSLRR
jgi:hypothetical protein